MIDPAESSAVRKASALLRQMWVQPGLDAIERRDYAPAIDWLNEALQHVAAGSEGDLPRAVAQAALGYASYRLGERHAEVACDKCLPQVQRDRASKRAKKARVEACKHASAALPCLRGDDSVALRVARGRAAFVMAQHHLEKNDFAQASNCFAVAIAAVGGLAEQAVLIEESLKGQFEAEYRRGEYAQSLPPVLALQARLSNQEARRAELAWLVACQSELLLLTGRYREADDQVHRWRCLTESLGADGRCSPQTAFGHGVFGRSRLALGHFNEAFDHLRRSHHLLECQPRCDRLHLLDVLLAEADLSVQMGDFVYACQQLAAAHKLLAAAEKKFNSHVTVAERRVRYSLIAARRALAMGRYDEARECFQVARQTAEQHCLCRYHLVAPSLLGLARADSEQGLTAEAIALVRCALDCLEQAAATATPEMACTLHELAFAYLQAGKEDEAQPPCESALRLLGMTLRTGHPSEAAMRVTLAQCLAAKHRSDRALEEVMHGREILQSHSPHHAFDVARALRVEAEIVHARASVDCAAGILRCARSLWIDHEARSGAVHPERTLLSLHLAAIHARCGNNAQIDAELKFDPFDELACQFKNSRERLAFEINRRANSFFKHGLFAEAAWQYQLAVDQYSRACGSGHAFTAAAAKHQKLAEARLAEPPPLEVCPCSPYYEKRDPVEESTCCCAPVCCT